MCAQRIADSDGSLRPSHCTPIDHPNIRESPMSSPTTEGTLPYDSPEYRAQMKARYANATRLQLHLGGWEVREGWTIVNVEDRPGVDVRSNCMDLSVFPDGSVVEIYASHVYEHLGYQEELPKALAEAKRVLMPGGRLRVAVPDLEVLAQLILNTQHDVNAQFFVQRMVMGGQSEPFDFHKTGFTQNILIALLKVHGFKDFRRVEDFKLFEDTSKLRFNGMPISLNMQCIRGADAS
jgi:predicted SAM-dependent methyltransferase